MGFKRRKPSSKYQVVDGIMLVPDPTHPRGAREYCTTDAAWDRRRNQVADRDKDRCKRCRRLIPRNERGITQGDAMHIKSSGAGGDDSIENLELGCRLCHGKRHQPKVVPSK